MATELPPFQPAWWLPGGHLQTIFPAIFRRQAKLEVRREPIELPDGDLLNLDWAPEQAGLTGASPLLVVLHGLEGSLRSPYVTGIMRVMSARGWRVLLMNFRGADGQPNRLARAYHSGETEDVAYLLSLLRGRFPEAPLFLLGYSLGASVTLNYLAERGEQTPLCAAAAVSTPFELGACAARVHRGLSRLYELRLMFALRRSLWRKFSLVSEALGLTRRQALGLWDFRSFDERITAPLHGFQNADDYYDKASCRPKLGKIRVPTLVLQADDDPFMGEDTTPSEEELPPQVRMERSASGGHIGFVAAGKRPFQPDYWLERRLPVFLEEALLRSRGHQ